MSTENLYLFQDLSVVICNFLAPNFGFWIGTFWVFYTSQISFAEFFCIRKLSYSESMMNSSVWKNFRTKKLLQKKFPSSTFEFLKFSVIDFSVTNFQDNLINNNFFTMNYKKQFFFRSNLFVLTQFQSFTFSVSEAFRSQTVFLRSFWSQTCFWATSWPMIFSTLLFLFIETPIIVFSFNKKKSATGFFAKHFSVNDTTS